MNIINQIIKEGKQVKLTEEQFSKIISNYYQKKYNIKGTFDFLTIIYKYIEESYVYDEELEHDRRLLKEKNVHAYLPCIIDKISYEFYKKRNIVIPGIINLDNLEEEINKVLPFGIVRVSNDEIGRIFNELGLSIPLYNWFHDKKTNNIEYNVIIKPLNLEEKTKVLEY